MLTKVVTKRVLTWKARLGLLLIFTLLAAWILANVRGFLALNAPLPQADILVVEGWVNDASMRKVLALYQQGHYQSLLVTGGPYTRGAMFRRHANYAQRGRKILIALGIAPEQIHAVPSPAVERNRTYASAIALKQWLDAQSLSGQRLNLASLDVHSRRSYLLFKKALVDHPSPTVAELGVIALPSGAYQGQRWWTSSEGFRSILGEALAYIYALGFITLEPSPNQAVETTPINTDAGSNDRLAAPTPGA